MYVQKRTIRASYALGRYTTLCQTEIYSILPLERMEWVAEGESIYFF